MTAANGLTETDYIVFELSWIPREVVDAACIHRVSSAEGADLVGYKNPGNYAGISFAYIWPGEERARDYRLRWDSPEVEYKSDGSQKEKRKYLRAPHGRNRLYFLFGIEPQALADVLDSFFY